VEAEEVGEEQLAAADGDAPAFGGAVAEGRVVVAWAVLVGAGSAAESAARSPVPAPVATLESAELEVATGAAVTAPLTVGATGAEAASATAVKVGAVCVSVALIWSV
jgi:hypothetical protein